MKSDTFFTQSIGTWRSQRSAHHLAFSHYEEVRSQIQILSLAADDPSVLRLCENNKISPEAIVHPFKMQWEGESDWDERANFQGSCVLVPVPDLDNPDKGCLLREQGYAEEMAAVGNYHFSEDGMFTLLTEYEHASAEERIWFVSPNLRFRVSLIKTRSGSGVTTASFSSEIRALEKSTPDIAETVSFSSL